MIAGCCSASTRRPPAPWNLMLRLQAGCTSHFVRDHHRELWADRRATKSGSILRRLDGQGRVGAVVAPLSSGGGVHCGGLRLASARRSLLRRPGLERGLDLWVTHSPGSGSGAVRGRGRCLGVQTVLFGLTTRMAILPFGSMGRPRGTPDADRQRPTPPVDLGWAAGPSVRDPARVIR